MSACLGDKMLGLVALLRPGRRVPRTGQNTMECEP